MMMQRTLARSPLLLVLLMSGACQSSPAGGTAVLSVVVEAESTITSGILAGSGDEEMQDGWAVAFDKYIAVLGEVDIRLATDPNVTGEDAEVYAVDLKKAPSSGFPLWKVKDLAEGRYEFNYVLSGAAHGQRHESVSEQDFARMAEEDMTYLIQGTLSKADGVSCPPKAFARAGDAVAVSTNADGDDCYANPTVRFDIGLTAETYFGPCEIDGLSGVVVSADTTETATISIHGDHLFFNGFPEGSEGGVVRRAQWLADSDLDVDGVVSKEELLALTPEDLPALSGIQLGGTPISPLDSLWTYAAAQLKTQGHYQGEGECAVDGAAPEHGEDHAHESEHDR